MNLIEYSAAFETLSSLGRRTRKCNELLDNRLSYNIARTIAKMDPIVTAYKKAIQEVAERFKAEGKFIMDDEDNTKIKVYEDGSSRICPAFIMDYQRCVTDVGTQEVEKEDYDKIAFSYSLLARNYDLTSTEWLTLMPFITDDLDQTTGNVEN